jgi:RNA polymerase sigma-70 factor (ECF subfamily)
MMDETALIQQAKHGDLDAFNRLVLAYQEQTYNLALRLLGDDPSAQDATQVAFINAFQSIKSFRGGSFRAWILRILTNACFDELRRQKRKPTEDLNPIDTSSGDELEDPAWLSDDSQSPEDHVTQQELEKAIQRCLRSLPEEFRAVIVLVDVQGMDYQEASEVVKKPLGTIRSRLARARRRVQECLQNAGELLPDIYRLNEESKS